MKNIMGYDDFLNEKWDKEVKIKKTDEYSGKTIDELESMLQNLKDRSKTYQDKNEKVPDEIKKKERQINFAIRSKRN
jgi:hypothetical protein